MWERMRLLLRISQRQNILEAQGGGRVYLRTYVRRKYTRLLLPPSQRSDSCRSSNVFMRDVI